MCEMFTNFEQSKYLSTLNQKADPIGVLFRDHPFNFHEHETKVRLSFFLGQENVTKSC